MSAAAPVVLPSLDATAFLTAIPELQFLAPKPALSSGAVPAGQGLSEFPELFGHLVQSASALKPEAEEQKPDKRVPGMELRAALVMATVVAPFVPVPFFTATGEPSMAPGDVRQVQSLDLEIPPYGPVSGGSDAAAGAPTFVLATPSGTEESLTTPRFTSGAPQGSPGGAHAAIEIQSLSVPRKRIEELALDPSEPHQPGKPPRAPIAATAGDDSSVLATNPCVTGPTPTAPLVPYTSATDLLPQPEEPGMMHAKILPGEAPVKPAPQAQPAYGGVEPPAARQPRCETGAPRLLEGPAPEPAAARMDLAFAARLVPLDPEPSSTLTQGKQPTFASGGDSSHSGNAGTGTAADLPATTAASVPAPRSTMGLADQEPKPSEESRPSRGPAQPETAMPGAPPAASSPAAPPERGHPPAEFHRGANAPPPDPDRAPAHAREIRLHLAGEERRVEVRLSERGGAVHVAVRTQDPRLASTLRDDLSTLSARLEQSGFRAETWRPDAARPEQLGRAFESHSAGTGADVPDSGSRQGDRHGREPLPRRTPEPETKTGSDSPPQEFSWLISSFR